MPLSWTEAVFPRDVYKRQQEIVRRDKLMELLEIGINPYPAPLYEVTHSAKQIKEKFNEENKEQFKSVSIACLLYTSGYHTIH